MCSNSCFCAALCFGVDEVDDSELDDEMKKIVRAARINKDKPKDKPKAAGAGAADMVILSIPHCIASHRIAINALCV